MPSGQGGAKKGDEGRAGEARAGLVKRKTRTAKGYGERPGARIKEMGPSEQEPEVNLPNLL